MFHPNEVKLEGIEGVQVFAFRQFEECNFIYLAVISSYNPNVFFKEKFYCAKCCRWLKISSTLGNIRSHIKSMHKEVLGTKNEPNFVELKYIQMFAFFLLKNGLSFRLVEDPIIQEMFPHMYTRKEQSDLCTEMAKKIREHLTLRLQSAIYISVAIDEWTDKKMRRYLGVHAHCTFAFEWKHFTLGFLPLISVHADAEALSNLTIKCFQSYSIDAKVDYIVSDTTAVMPRTTELCCKKWSPCYCHIMNLTIGDFTEALSGLIDPILSLQRNLSMSTGFTSFCSASNSSITRIPSFTQTRWYSMYDMLYAICELKPIIIAYLSMNHKNPVDNSVWTVTAELKATFSSFKEAIAGLESNNYGTKSIVIMAFSMVSQQVNRLTGEAWLPAVNAFHDSMVRHWQQYYDVNRPELMIAARLNPATHAFFTTRECVEVDQLIQLIYIFIYYLLGILL